MRKNIPVQALLVCYLFIIFSKPMFAGDYSGNISEDYLHTLFTFKADEKLKYSQCEEKTYYTCTYIWGIESSKDAARINLGLAPKGNKLQITYAQAKNEKDFQRVISSYSDAIIVNNIGKMAIWSEKRKQLSLITAENLIIHVHIESQDIDSKEKSISIAKNVLVKS